MIYVVLLLQATNEVIGQVPKATQAEMEAAANAAAKAFPTWSQTSILARQQVMFKLQHLIKENMVSIIACILHDSRQHPKITILWCLHAHAYTVGPELQYIF